MMIMIFVCNSKLCALQIQILVEYIYNTPILHITCTIEVVLESFHTVPERIYCLNLNSLEIKVSRG